MVKMNHLAVLFALCLVIPLASATSKAVEYCNKNFDYPVQVSGVEITPYPIIKGQPATFAISASTDKPIPGGKMKIDVTYLFFHVHSEEQDLCEGTSCPVPVGDFVISHSQVLPGIAPPGGYTIKMTMLDGKKKQLTCFSFDFSIGFLAPENLASS